MERLVTVYSKPNILDLHTFLRENFSSRPNSERCVEEVLVNFKAILCQKIEKFVAHKMLRKHLDPEYYYKEVKCLKVKAREA
jgi:hypothetical protein